MGPPLLGDIWTRRGISIIWDAEMLASLCKPNEVISLRQFLQLLGAGWPDDSLSLVRDQALVVAGLEGCLDALPPQEACEWLEQTIYPAIIAFQREVAGGGDQASLVLWLADARRMDYHTSDDTYYWHCGTEYKGQQIPLSRCLFNGAQSDLRRIHVTRDRNVEHWVGLYHPRIS
jgi:hypothetical protein